MERTPVWLLPAALAVLQLAAWPGLAYATREHVTATSAATAVAVTVTVAVALLWRRTAPIATTGVVVAALTVAELGLPPDSLSVITVADIVMLYGIAVRRPQRTALTTAAALIVWQTALVAGDDELGGDFPAALAVLVVLYMGVAALGRARHRWYADRADAATRLAEAEQRRSRAADTERHRLARELHDVTAHHLTSIVVIASAAQRVGAARPELVAEARDFAVRTGRETLTALQRLVALLQEPGAPGPSGGLTELADGFRRLGQRVTVEGTHPMGPAVAEAAHGIAREALTNTLRYAPGASVTVRLTGTPDGARLTVADDGPAGATTDGSAARLGSGRGIGGMRERAAALGGTLEAGPRPGGGWQVDALLPADAAPVPGGARRPGPDSVIDAAVLLLALGAPAAGLLVALEEGDLPAGAASLAALTLIGHALPLAWRRTRPWTVLTAVLVTGWVWPLLIATRLLTITHGWIAVTGAGAEVLAVHAVARYGRRPALTWLSIPAVLGCVMSAVSVMLLLDPPEDTAASVPATFLIMAIVGGIPLSLPVSGAWLAGFLARRRRERVRAREDHAVAAATAWALVEAGAERARVAAGLREAVLRDTARVPEAADRGDLDAVVGAARTALDGMRGLLNDLRDAPAGEDQARAPQPTLAALPGLVDRWRAGGRTVDLELIGTGRRLSTDLDVSAYRVVELLLAGDTGPVRVRVDLAGDPLRLAVSPMPEDAGGEVAAGLRARLAAVGGSLTVAGDGSTEILLPAPRDGHDEPAPRDGHDEPAPRDGHDEPAPGHGHDGPAPPQRAGEDEEVATSPRV
ncbi:histidine kinase [Couchioplanes caeruleus]|uniref:ATP-binding protein n=1 Tax=Couchioplanes caeruleus TaxID=56438 RepID=UPI00201C6BDD|nr:histidine kinase [Couchioplanes caeruleus]UQU61428.1 histidine kinase [Couchioplanes caeruleus]